MKTFSIPPFYLYLLVKKTFLANYNYKKMTNQSTDQRTNYNQKNINVKQQNLKFYP